MAVKLLTVSKIYEMDLYSCTVLNSCFSAGGDLNFEWTDKTIVELMYDLYSRGVTSISRTVDYIDINGEVTKLDLQFTSVKQVEKMDAPGAISQQLDESEIFNDLFNITDDMIFGISDIILSEDPNIETSDIILSEDPNIETSDIILSHSTTINEEEITVNNFLIFTINTNITF